MNIAYLLIIFFLVIICSCENKSDSTINTDIPGSFSIKCEEEAVADAKTYDASVVKKIIDDSVEFKKEIIANCCGWFDNLKLIDINDTIKLKNFGPDEIELCDCNCLFAMKITIAKKHLDTSKKFIDF